MFEINRFNRSFELRRVVKGTRLSPSRSQAYRVHWQLLRSRWNSCNWPQHIVTHVSCNYRTFEWTAYASSCPIRLWNISHVRETFRHFMVFISCWNTRFNFIRFIFNFDKFSIIWIVIAEKLNECYLNELTNQLFICRPNLPRALESTLTARLTHQNHRLNFCS